MKITIQQRALLEGLSVVLPVVPGKTTKEVCKSIKLTACGESLHIEATDLEAWISHRVDCLIGSDGSALLPADRGAAIVRQLPDGPVTIEVVDGKTILRTDSAEFVLQAEDAAGFPSGTSEDVGAGADLETAKLLGVIRRVLVSVDEDSTRYALGGAQLNIEGDHCFAVSTDSRRLTVAGAMRSTAINGTVPAKILRLIQGMARGRLRIAISDNRVAVWDGTTAITGRLLEGRFPRWQDVLPKEFKHEITLPVATTLSAVRQAMICQNAESRGVDFVFEEGHLTLRSRAADVGESAITTPCGGTVLGFKFNVTFDPKFIADFLKQCHSGGTATLHLIDENAAALFTHGDEYRYLVMPLAKD